MSDAPSNVSADSDRAVLFAQWLKPLVPARPTYQAVAAKIAPWHQHFVSARQQGFSWQQLAQKVANQPEIGVKISGVMLRRAVADACAKAGEPFDERGPGHRRHVRRKKSATARTAPASTASSAPSASKAR